MNIRLIIKTLIILLFANHTFAQGLQELDSLITSISKEVKNSKEIIRHSSSRKVFAYGTYVLPKLIYFFEETDSTNIYSECQERLLLKGEIAIILADIIEPMQYYYVTGVQNCLMTYCEDNTNYIEYYLRWYDDREARIKLFTSKYKESLANEEREKWIEILKPLDQRLKEAGVEN
ncbi:hypothetical protein KMW28_17160 [Flammeovirga yaeyamensis]|uniref:Uncharacterized protein n=1 Tax=Flammeovirga yaeyamensis TaxID=367791 RepID=A0AAX1N1I9_9BACT|nr:hypothetical protein [Flammeovirga yaeyamensis]MBB3698252.1 hypothetical protein [Flammeovirga yaeyamensis]NMF34393.1 hypothetical protein [Flammeovirga yaeyamensis]QWG01374.1 hypothetical protein KMW28_17160 [Flammeovirga yaeyamensis]